MKAKSIFKSLLYYVHLGRIPTIRGPISSLPTEGNHEAPKDIVSSQRAFNSILRQIPLAINHPNPQLVRQILVLLRPLNVIGKTLIRRGHNADGGYVMLDDHIDNTVAYSLGISDEVSWDLDMAKSGCQVFQYDHTIQRAPRVHPNLHFSRIGIAGRSSPDGVFKSLSDLVHENGNDGRSDMILKMDIEGSEWSVVRELRQSTLNQFSHVLIEWHFDFHEIAGVDSLGLVLSTLEKINASHQVIHVHANNCGRMAVVAGVSIPEGIEVTYVRRNSHLFEECRKVYPTPLDRPNDPNMPDYILGAFGQL
jgi:hypothetical protein